MGRFDGFEEIGAWQKAYAATMRIYRVTEDGRFSRDFGLRDQIRRASVSVLANIAEGHGRRSNIEFANFLNIARGSAHEVQSHLYIAKALGYIEETEFDELYIALSEVSKMTFSLARYLRNNQDR
jgi:four helix bundle protein